MKITEIPGKYKKDIEFARNLLKKEGCKSVYVFGSLATGKVNANSDIDFGVSGLPSFKFFKVYSQLNQNLKSNFDLVDFDEKHDLYDLLLRLGEVVEIE